MEDRERFEEVKKVESVSTMIHNCVSCAQGGSAGALLYLALLQLAHGPAVHVQTDGCQGYVDQRAV